MRVKLSKLASVDIRVAAKWWKANRERAPALLRDEIQQALQLLVVSPLAGVHVPDDEVLTLRRLSLLQTRYLLFYEVDEAGQVTVLRLWHASRGQAPRLR